MWNSNLYRIYSFKIYPSFASYVLLLVENKVQSTYCKFSRKIGPFLVINFIVGNCLLLFLTLTPFLLTSVSVTLFHQEAKVLLHYQYLPWHKITAALSIACAEFLLEKLFCYCKRVP